MRDQILSGTRIPGAMLAYIKNDVLVAAPASDLFASGKIVILGIPGAFTPVCSQTHLPDFLRNVPKLRASGFGMLACVAPNDPYVLQAWASVVDPGRTVEFFSDGNLDFARALGLAKTHRELFLGERTERYMLIAVDGLIQRVRIEPSILDVSCTGAFDALEKAS
jgi:peroxiredoxin